MTADVSRETVLDLLSAAVERPVEVGNDEPLIGSGLVDSLSILGLVSSLEEKYEFEFDENELTVENFETLVRIITLVEGKLASA